MLFQAFRETVLNKQTAPYPANLDQIRVELHRLMQEHIQSMENQTFLGINSDDLLQHRLRLDRIRKVSADFLEALERSGRDSRARQ